MFKQRPCALFDLAALPSSVQNPSQQLKFEGVAMSTRHLTFNLRKHRKYTWRMLTFSSLQSCERQRNPRATHPLPRAASPIRATHPMSRAPSSGPRATHPAAPPWAPSSVPSAAVLRAPSSDPCATHPARRDPFFQERTLNLTVWGRVVI